MTKTNWLGRTLVESPLYYCLVTSEKEYAQVLRKLKVPRDMWNSWLTKDACVNFYRHGTNGANCAIVSMDITTGVSLVQMNALLVHEAVHIWQEIKRQLGEGDPSAEFEAYSIQRISLELMAELSERLEKVTSKEEPIGIDQMVSNFLSWKLPKDFSPDGGIVLAQQIGHKFEPSGTNLFNAEQAKAMIKHIMEY